MRRLVRFFIISALMLLLPFHSVWAAEDTKYPKPSESGYVNDFAGILSDEAGQKMISIGRELDLKTKAQIVVVTIDKIPDNAPIEEYANGLFREWGIGDRRLNNGILLIVNTDPQNRRARIEVGEGLEGRVPDAIANRIMNERIIPYFKQGDYNSGILNGYISLSQKVAEEYNVTLSGTQENYNNNQYTQRQSPIPVILIILGLFLFDGVFFRFRILQFLLFMLAMNGRGGRRGGGGFGGGPGGGFGGFGGGTSGGGGSSGSW